MALTIAANVCKMKFQVSFFFIIYHLLIYHFSDYSEFSEFSEYSEYSDSSEFSDSSDSPPLRGDWGL